MKNIKYITVFTSTVNDVLNQMKKLIMDHGVANPCLLIDNCSIYFGPGNLLCPGNLA